MVVGLRLGPSRNRVSLLSELFAGRLRLSRALLDVPGLGFGFSNLREPFPILAICMRQKFLQSHGSDRDGSKPVLAFQDRKLAQEVALSLGGAACALLRKNVSVAVGWPEGLCGSDS